MGVPQSKATCEEMYGKKAREGRVRVYFINLIPQAFILAMLLSIKYPRYPALMILPFLFLPLLAFYDWYYMADEYKKCKSASQSGVKNVESA